MKKLISAGLALIAATALLAGCQNGAADSAPNALPENGESVTVKIGTTDASEPHWPVLQEKLKADGINLEVVNFGDYSLPNKATTDGSVDLNLFQHLQFLATYNVKAGADLVPIKATVVVPLGLYSHKHKSVEEIPQGGKVAIPNDPSNQARALLVLQEAGLLKLKDGGNSLSTPAEILTDESKVTVVPVDASQTVLSLDSVDASIINNGFVAKAGLDFKSAIFEDDPSSKAAEPYINAFVTRKGQENNPVFQKIIEAYHSPEIEELVLKSSGGTAVIKDNDAADLQRILSGIEENLRKQNN